MLDEVAGRLGIDRGGTLYGVLLNTQASLRALGDAVHDKPYQAPPKAPILYLKPRNTWARPGAAIPVPAGVPALRMGPCLGIVIGRTACRVMEAEALDHVAGYVLVNDVSIPHDSLFRPAVRQRCGDGFCPIGNVLPHEAVPDPAAVAIRVEINGELVGEWRVGELIRSVSRLLADVTDFMSLSPGDVLLFASPHDGPLAGPGDLVRITAPGFGLLENRLSAEVRP